jgi:hypothetical protein
MRLNGFSVRYENLWILYKYLICELKVLVIIFCIWTKTSGFPKRDIFKIGNTMKYGNGCRFRLVTSFIITLSYSLIIKWAGHISLSLFIKNSNLVLL